MRTAHQRFTRARIDGQSQDLVRQVLLRRHLHDAACFAESIEDLLRAGIRQQVLRGLDTKSLANALMGIIAYSKFAWIMNPSGASLLGKVDDVLNVFLRGAAAVQDIGQAEASLRDQKNSTQEAG